MIYYCINKIAITVAYLTFFWQQNDFLFFFVSNNDN